MSAALSTSARLSLMLQDLAASISTILHDVTGDDLAFVLVIQADKTAQYISNASRKDGTELIESLLARWKAGRADIPAHYNPDLAALSEPATAAPEPVAAGWASYFPSGEIAQATTNPKVAQGWRNAGGDVRPLFDTPSTPAEQAAPQHRNAQNDKST